MLSSERFDKILDIINKKGNATISYLVDKIGTSESTVRRDIIKLDQMGLVKKIHGGATAISKKYLASESSLNDRIFLNKNTKIEIAKYAASLINDMDTIYIDSGSTTKYMLEFINAKDILVVTNSIHHSLELTNKGIKVIIIGGEIRPVSEAIEGPFARELLSKLNFDKAFIGSNGFDEHAGFTTPSPSEAEIKRLAIRQSKKAYILADSSKENLVTLSKFADFDDVTLITEKISNKFLSIDYILAKN